MASTLTVDDRAEVERELEEMFAQLGDKAGRVLPGARLQYEQWVERTLGEIRRLQQILATEGGDQ